MPDRWKKKPGENLRCDFEVRVFFSEESHRIVIRGAQSGKIDSMKGTGHYTFLVFFTLLRVFLRLSSK